MSQNTLLPLRSEVPLAHTWNLESIFASPAEWENACQELNTQIPLLAAYQ